MSVNTQKITAFISDILNILDKENFTLILKSKEFHIEMTPNCIEKISEQNNSPLPEDVIIGGFNPALNAPPVQQIPSKPNRKKANRKKAKSNQKKFTHGQRIILNKKYGFVAEAIAHEGSNSEKIRNHLTVLQGSEASLNVDGSAEARTIKNTLISDSILVLDLTKSKYIFAKNHYFDSPTVATSVVIGAYAKNPYGDWN